MNDDTSSRGDYRLLIGLLTGAAVGAGLAIWLRPRVVEFRDRLTESARDLRKTVSAEYQCVSDRVDATVDDLTRTGQQVRDNVADAVARGAHEVERLANAAKTDRSPDARTYPAA